MAIEIQNGTGTELDGVSIETGESNPLETATISRLPEELPSLTETEVAAPPSPILAGASFTIPNIAPAEIVAADATELFELVGEILLDVEVSPTTLAEFQKLSLRNLLFSDLTEELAQTAHASDVARTPPPNARLLSWVEQMSSSIA